MSGDNFGCHHSEGAIDIWWLGARDTSKHPTVHRKAPYNKEVSIQNINSVEGEKPWSRQSSHSKLFH